MSDREIELLRIARRVQRYFHNQATNPALNGPNDSVWLARGLFSALVEYADVPVTSDADKAAPILAVEGR